MSYELEVLRKARELYSAQFCANARRAKAIRIGHKSLTADDHKAIRAVADALLHGARRAQCWCLTCRPMTPVDMRFVMCPECGNKRCPRANDHRHLCTGSNEPGQLGSAYPPPVSATTKQLIDQLIDRDRKGLAKYGTTLDRADLTPEQWLQHMAEELMDGAGYALAAIRTLREGKA